MWIYIIASVSCCFSIAAFLLLYFRKKKHGFLPIALGVFGLITSYVAVAIASPRNLDPSKLDVDYLGIIVSILAAFATLLLGMQLYYGLKVKESADEVSDYSKKVANLEKSINDLGLHIIDNPEYFYAITDAEDKVLFGIKRDKGEIAWKEGVPEPIQKELEKLGARIVKLESQKKSDDK